MPDVRKGAEALDHIDQALADRPRRDGRTLKAAVQCLAEFRDHHVELHRREGGAHRKAALERVNAVISVIMAAEFPLGEVPWDEMEKARGWLAGILRDEAGQ